MTDLAPPRGMRDFYPDDYRAREALFNAWRRAATLAGFEFWDSPVVETLDLLERKGGEEIGDQLYTFTDKSGRRLALRAELTPSLARMIIARQGSLVLPLKWAAIGQCFRYERMTRGRKREHYQLNLDIVGEASVMAEAEVIGTAVESLRLLGLTADDLKVRVGSRALLGALFARSGLGVEHFEACCLALDKRGKIPDEEVAGLLIKEGMRPEDVGRAFEWMRIASLDEAAQWLGDASHPALAELRLLFELAADLGFAEWLVFDPGIVRGLGYYTGIVFEAFDTQRRLRAIFGGGRYDNLLQALGGRAVPCVGLGFGDVVVMELLAELGRAPATERTVEFAVGYLDEVARAAALRVAARLRAAGRSCDLGLHPEKARRFFDRANRGGARRAIFLGPDELAAGVLVVKPMAGGEPLRLPLDAFDPAAIP